MGRQYRTKTRGEGLLYDTENLGTATTGSTVVSISNYGISLLSSGANTWTLDAPTKGCVKTLIGLAAGTSTARLVKLSPVSSGDSVTVVQGGTSGVAATEILVATTDCFTIALYGLSETEWKVLYNTTGHASPSTGITYQTS